MTAGLLVDCTDLKNKQINHKNKINKSIKTF